MTYLFFTGFLVLVFRRLYIHDVCTLDSSDDLYKTYNYYEMKTRNNSPYERNNWQLRKERHRRTDKQAIQRNKITKNGQPEKYIIKVILHDMYSVHTGFDPEILSKLIFILIITWLSNHYLIILWYYAPILYLFLSY